jgi:hypothetical protein
MIRGLIDTGRGPSNPELERALGVDRSALVSILRELEAAHGIVLHPDRPEPWVIHPFSLTPTATWVQGADRGWWAPCVWCGLGVAALAGGDVQLHTRFGGEQESAMIDVRDGAPVESGHCVVHFAIPPARAWDNVHAHCAMLLPFRSPSDVDVWTMRHALPLGEVVPLAQVAALARRWYGGHADPQWRKWTVAEAQDIFASVGLTSTFWDLGAQVGRF